MTSTYRRWACLRILCVWGQLNDLLLPDIGTKDALSISKSIADDSDVFNYKAKILADFGLVYKIL